MHTLKGIVIELPNSNAEIYRLLKPEGVEIIFTEEDFLNASGSLSEICINFIFQAIGTSILNKVGEDIYDYLKKIILKNNYSKEAYDIKIKIKTNDFMVSFDVKKLNEENISAAIEDFSKTANSMIAKMHSLKSQSGHLVFDENTKKWCLENTKIQKSIEDIRNEAMDKFND